MIGYPELKIRLNKINKEAIVYDIVYNPINTYLINEAKKLKIKRLSIETGAGDFFLPARKLFEKTGFTVCGPFAHYKKDVNSVYLTMLIDDI